MIDDPIDIASIIDVSADVPDDRGFEENEHGIKGLNDWNLIAQGIARELNEKGV